MIIWVSHAFSWYWYIHATCEVLSWFILETRIPLNYVSLCDCLEPIIDDFIRPECRKRQSNFYIAIRWNSAQWSLACLEYWFISLLFFYDEKLACKKKREFLSFLFFLSIMLGLTNYFEFFSKLNVRRRASLCPSPVLVGKILAKSGARRYAHSEVEKNTNFHEFQGHSCTIYPTPALRAGSPSVPIHTIYPTHYFVLVALVFLYTLYTLPTTSRW